MYNTGLFKHYERILERVAVRVAGQLLGSEGTRSAKKYLAAMLLEKNVGEMESSNTVETATFSNPSVVEGVFYGVDPDP